jgi:hypothetical protein
VRVELDEDHERELIGSLALVYAGRRTEFASFLAARGAQEPGGGAEGSGGASAVARPRLITP